MDSKPQRDGSVSEVFGFMGMAKRKSRKSKSFLSIWWAKE